MTRFFISAVQKQRRIWNSRTRFEPDAATVEQDLATVCDGIMTELKTRNCEVVFVPPQEHEVNCIQWINHRAFPQDLALKFEFEHVLETPSQKPTPNVDVFYLVLNHDRQKQAETLINALNARNPMFFSPRALPDTASELGYLNFCRLVAPASLVLSVKLVTGLDGQLRDFSEWQQEDWRHSIAVGITEGLQQACSGFGHLPFNQSAQPLSPEMLESATGQHFPEHSDGQAIEIRLNGRTYEEQGMVMNGNPFIPADLGDRLGIPPNKTAELGGITYGGVVYMRAADLQTAPIAVTWEPSTQVLNLRSHLPICGTLDGIAGNGYTTEVQMLMFLKTHNEEALTHFPDIARLYREESQSEGINHDVAFSQMCVETHFLRFQGMVKANQHNFGGLGASTLHSAGATFPSARIGVRAHIQHLKAHANTEPLREEIVDPRFTRIRRGCAANIPALVGRWSSDPYYGDRILAVLRQLYQSAGIL